MLLSRPLDHYEKPSISNEVLNTVQLGIKVSKPSLIPKIIDNFSKFCIGLHTYCKNNKIEVTKQDILVHKIPKTIKNPKIAADWFYQKFKLNVNKSLCNIACNDDIAVFNSSHICCDGANLKYILDHCLDDDVEESIFVPSSVYQIFNREIENSKTNIVIPQSPTVYKWKNPLQDQVETQAQYITRVIPSKKLISYSRPANRLVGLTESLWISDILAASVYNGNFESAGSITITDLRQFTKSSRYLNGSYYSAFPVIAKDVTENTKLKDLAKILRANYIDGIQSGAQFRSFNDSKMPWQNNFEVGPLILSNVGPVKAKFPIIDFWMQQRMGSKPAACDMCLFSYSKIINGANDVVIQKRFAPHRISKADVERIVNQICFSLTELNSEFTIKEAMKQIENIK